MQKEKLKDFKETKEGREVKINKIFKNKRGITLIALVVTIVVLLILAGVSISLVVDNNGIIKRSKEARSKYGEAKENEQAQMSGVSDWIDKQVGENGGTKVNPTVPGWENKKDDNSTINGGEKNSNNPTIPAGYVPINTDTSNWGDGSSAPTQDSVDHGLVIKDDKNNEWVWVPVDSATLATMYETSSDVKTLCGTTVTTNKYSKSEIINRQTRTTPGTADDWREPDLVVGDGTGYDAEEYYYKTILGFDSKEKMAEAFVEDYNEMIASVETYGGFYIGRYELSEEGVKKDKATLVKTNWYNLYKKCKELNASNKVETRMIWGCQWDVTCNFIANKGDKKSITDSSSWGNYEGTSVKADDGKTEIKASETKQILNTGKTTFTMANNIYDLAGNCSEWSQEAYNTYSRVCRGGEYTGFGYDYPASDRNLSGDPYHSGYDKGRFSSNSNNKIKLL